jgi:hypothetical protein
VFLNGLHYGEVCRYCTSKHIKDLDAMLRQYLLEKQAITTAYKTTLQEPDLSGDALLFRMDPSHANTVRLLNKKINFELSEKTQIVNPIARKNSKQNQKHLAQYLVENKSSAAIQLIQDQFRDIETDYMINLALQYQNIEVCEFLLTTEPYASLISPNSLKSLAATFPDSNLILHILNGLHVKKIGYDYLVALSSDTKNEYLAVHLISDPKILSRIVSKAICQLGQHFPNLVELILRVLTDPNTVAANPNRNPRWVGEAIDWLYFNSFPAKQLIHQNEAYILCALDHNSFTLTKEKIGVLRTQYLDIDETIVASPLLCERLGLPVVVAEAPADMDYVAAPILTNYVRQRDKDIIESIAGLSIQDNSSKPSRGSCFACCFL